MIKMLSQQCTRVQIETEEHTVCNVYNKQFVASDIFCRESRPQARVVESQN